jgi:threonine/homoserine/homoserine lactone efflux protein
MLGNIIMASSFTIIFMGAFFGFTAGISPGPLLTLVITQTLRHNRKEGIKIALAPLITDMPIILITYFIFSTLSQFDIILSVISISGGIFFTYLGYESFKSNGLDLELLKANPDSLRKGITANLLNPHPYVFWMTIGIPTAFKAYEINLPTALLYFLLFYTMLIGSKVSIAIIVEKSKSFLNNRAFIFTMQILATALFAFAILFFYNGIKTLFAC